jgi:hypothetical protein
MDVAAIEKLFGFLDSLIVMVCKQNLRGDEVALGADGKNAVFRHRAHAGSGASVTELTVTEMLPGAER